MSAIVTCPHCGKKNRVRPSAEGVPRCGNCHNALPWLVDADAASATAKARGEIASALNPPPGCHFNPRCPLKADRCVSEVPALEAVAAGHRAACHFRDRVG